MSVSVEKGQKWRLKHQPYKVARITYVEISNSVFGGYVRIFCPWLKNTDQGRCMDTFLKQFERLPTRIN